LAVGLREHGGLTTAFLAEGADRPGELYRSVDVTLAAPPRVAGDNRLSGLPASGSTAASRAPPTSASTPASPAKPGSSRTRGLVGGFSQGFATGCRGRRSSTRTATTRRGSGAPPWNSVRRSPTGPGSAGRRSRGGTTWGTGGIGAPSRG